MSDAHDIVSTKKQKALRHVDEWRSLSIIRQIWIREVLELRSKNIQYTSG